MRFQLSYLQMQIFTKQFEATDIQRFNNSEKIRHKSGKMSDVKKGKPNVRCKQLTGLFHDVIQIPANAGDLEFSHPVILRPEIRQI